MVKNIKSIEIIITTEIIKWTSIIKDLNNIEIIEIIITSGIVNSIVTSGIINV